MDQASMDARYLLWQLRAVSAGCLVLVGKEGLVRFHGRIYLQKINPSAGSGPPVFHQETIISHLAKSLQSFFLFFLFGQHIAASLSWQLSFVPHTLGVSAVGQAGRQREGRPKSQGESEAFYDLRSAHWQLCVRRQEPPRPQVSTEAALPSWRVRRPRAWLGGAAGWPVIREPLQSRSFLRAEPPGTAGMGAAEHPGPTRSNFSTPD